MSTTKPTRIIRKIFYDKENNLVLFQFPNLPIIVWILASIFSKVFSGTLSDIFGYISFGALFTWAWLEIFDGDTYFRRLLGLVVITFAVLNKVKM